MDILKNFQAGGHESAQCFPESDDGSAPESARVLVNFRAAAAGGRAGRGPQGRFPRCRTERPRYPSSGCMPPSPSASLPAHIAPGFIHPSMKVQPPCRVAKHAYVLWPWTASPAGPGQFPRPTPGLVLVVGAAGGGRA